MVLQNTDSHGEEITKWGDRPPPTRMQNTGRLCNPLILASPPGPGGVSLRSPVWILQWGCSDQWHVRHVRHVIQPSMEAEPAAAVERWEQFPAPPVVSEGEGGDTILIVSTSAIPRTLARSHTLLRASHHADWARDNQLQCELHAEWKHAEFEIVKMNAIKVPSLDCRDGDGHIVSLIITSYYHCCHFSLLGAPRQFGVSTFHKRHYYYVLGWKLQDTTQ